MPDNTYNIQDPRQPSHRDAAGDKTSVLTAGTEPENSSSAVTLKAETSFYRLLSYCEKENYKGYDPYDGLNSSIFRSLPGLRKNRIARLAWIQAFKRLPFNLRPVAGIKKEYNPKALGLFLSGYCNLFRFNRDEDYLDRIIFLSQTLSDLQNREWSGACWGYNFDWQARAFFQPRNTPTVVATTFIGCAFLDAYDITRNEKMLEIARSACRFILNDLNRTTDSNGNFAFSYSPLDNTVVFNASLLGSRLLSRVYSHTSEKELIDAAAKSVRYCCNRQNADGSWSYGLQNFHEWIDNFHTGYNLECIAEYIRYSGDNSVKGNLDRGLKYYLKTFFTGDGIPKYYNNSLYPIDIHSSAQLVATVVRTSSFTANRQLAEKVLDWTIENMQSEAGYFYYQLNRFFSSRIPYMRWAQAWMFYALSMYLQQVKTAK